MKLKTRKNWWIALITWILFFAIPVISIDRSYGKENAILYATALIFLELVLSKAEKED